MDLDVARRVYRSKLRTIERTYGITPEDLAALIDAQDEGCPVCHEPITLGVLLGSSSPTDYAVDHDHKTGAVRGVLCRSCNIGLGNFRDSPSLLRSAARYLERA